MSCDKLQKDLDKHLKDVYDEIAEFIDVDDGSALGQITKILYSLVRRNNDALLEYLKNK